MSNEKQRVLQVSHATFNSDHDAVVAVIDNHNGMSTNPTWIEDDYILDIVSCAMEHKARLTYDTWDTFAPVSEDDPIQDPVCTTHIETHLVFKWDGDPEKGEMRCPFEFGAAVRKHLNKIRAENNEEHVYTNPGFYSCFDLYASDPISGQTEYYENNWFGDMNADWDEIEKFVESAYNSRCIPVLLEAQHMTYDADDPNARYNETLELNSHMIEVWRGSDAVVKGNSIAEQVNAIREIVERANQ